MSDDGYPAEEELARIRGWDPRDGYGLLDFARSIWWHPDWGFSEKNGVVSVSTGGWSGNEDIIQAMVDNAMWWTLHWLSSRRGGHYEFKPMVPR